MEEEKTKAGELYALINQRTKEIGGNLLPSEILLGSMVEVIRSADFTQSADGRKALLFNDVMAQTFLLVFDSMTDVYESDRFKEFGRVLKKTVKEGSPTRRAEYEAFKKAMNGNNETDENTSIGFGR